MAFDLEEQEQIESLRAFWSRWGTLLMSLAILGTLSFAAYKAYGWYQVQQSQKASQVYETYVNALQKKDAGATAILANLQKDYSQSRYTTLASLDAANAAIADKQWEQAIVPLQWLIDNSSVESQAVARLQLADILAQLGKSNEAIKTLDIVPSPTFTAAFANKKADVYLLMKDNAKARASVQVAIDWVNAQSVKDEVLQKVLQEKLDSLPS